MPALPNVPQVLRFNMHWQVDGDTMGQTISHFRYSGSAPSSADCNGFAIAAVAIGETAFAGLCNTHVGMLTATVTDLTGPSAGQGNGGTPWLGTRSGGQLSPGTAAVVRHIIGRRYRGGKPRTYLPAGTATDVTTVGLWSAGFVSAVDAGWGTFTSDLIGATSGSTTLSAIVNVSYYHGSTVVISPTTGRARNVPTVRGTPLVDTISGHTVDTIIGSQRRRNRAA